MRKYDYLRNVMKKLEDAVDVYDIDLPKHFRRRGDKLNPYCVLWLKNGAVVGLKVVHSTTIEVINGNKWVEWEEYFPITPTKKFKGFDF